VNLLHIKNLTASIDGKEILRGVNLEVKPGEVHAIMGPNGSGKSTLSKVIAGHPDYEVTGGEVIYSPQFRPKDLLEMDPFERAREGIFLAFQYPVELPGISNELFLRASFDEICRAQEVPLLSDADFHALLLEKAKLVEMDPSFLTRPVNLGFSGGEKKRNEILQMAMLQPRVAFLDETDSGLDIDSLRQVAGGVNKLRSSSNAFVIITHYQRLLNYITPDVVHVFWNGQIIKSGGRELALELEEKGYDWLKPEAQGPA
jgi:Fe-S cluster assembly ATP-binding protein